ncbi:ubiquinone/menaquinone biosynthesis C-methylase UbiE [Streptacidiphilus sp. MAP5-52]
MRVSPGRPFGRERLVLGRAYKTRMLDELDARPGQTVVDLGCGPGTDLDALADAVVDGGSGAEGAGVGSTAVGSVVVRGAVVGVDHDQAAVAKARERTAGRPGVTVQQADLHHLPLPDGFADRARTDRVLQHVADPAQALREMRRVLRPGGRIVLGEPDWATLAVDHPESELSDAYTRFVSTQVVRNGRIGRQLPRLAVEAGFRVPAVLPVTPVFRDVREADAILGLERTTRRAVTAGYFTEDEAQRWLDHLTRGPFLATVTFQIVVGAR